MPINVLLKSQNIFQTIDSIGQNTDVQPIRIDPRTEEMEKQKNILTCLKPKRIINVETSA